jgi:aryl-alcohol dehydrogenase-like predicted oxidoreductase
VVTAPIISPSTNAQWLAVREAVDVELSEDAFAEVSEIFTRPEAQRNR